MRNAWKYCSEIEIIELASNMHKYTSLLYATERSRSGDHILPFCDSVSIAGLPVEVLEI